MAKRLAITISGAVSLGSYEAGVLWEILNAIRQHDSNPLTELDNRIHVDVLTGASAGGMTAIILGQKLLCSGDQFQGPYNNPLYNCWVKRISLQGLQDTQRDEPALHSMFSSDLIEQISRETLLDRYKSASVPAAVPHAAAAPTIRIGVALTNLNGVNYGLTVQPEDKFIYIRYVDQMTRVADGEACDSQEFWEPLRQAAVACGAFPFAFRTQDMERSARTEPQDYPAENLIPWDNDPQTFTYTDGGVFQNQPLGMAKNMVDGIDQHLDQENRFYLFVSPNAKDTEASDNFREENADYVHLLLRLISVIFGQAGFQDWITAEGLNDRIKLLDKRADELKGAILAGMIDVGSLQKTVTAIRSLFFENGVHKSPGAAQPEALVDAQARIANQYKEEMEALKGVPGAPQAFRDSVLVFETAAGLGARDKMTIYGVTAMDSELAGAGLEAFLGFFDQIFRDHDYDVGRTHARRFLNNPVVSQPGGIGPLNLDANQPAIRPIEHRLDGLRLSHVPVGDLAQFKNRAKDRVNEMMRELIGNWSIVADPVADRFLSAALDLLISKS